MLPIGPLLPLSLASLAASVLAQELAPEAVAEARRIAAIAPSDHRPPPRTVDVVHYALHVAVDPQARRIEGRAEIELKPFAAPRRVIQLDADELSIQSVVDGAGAPLAFKHERTTLEIDLGRDLAPEEATRIVVAYAAAPRRGLVFVPAQDGSCSMVWSQGECSMSSAWFPCRDYPDDRASSELFVTLPDAWKSISNGVLIESTPAGSEQERRRTDHWRMDFPHPAYLTSVALGPFVEIDLGRVRDLPLLAYATADRRDAAALSLQPTGAMVERIEMLTGAPYPYPAYRQVCVAGFPWEGMENVAATTLAEDQLLAPDRPDEGRAAAEALIVHELAHQWFGDLVSPASWSDLWLNEGFATFAEPWWIEKNAGADEALAAWAKLQEEAVEHRTKEPRPIVSSTCVTPDDLFDATIYASAGSFLNLLRRVVGDAKFEAGVKAWIARGQGRSLGTAEFEATFEQAAGPGLGDLFHEWLHSPGLPAIDFSWSWDPAARRLELTAHQKQTGEGVPEVYHVPVDIAWQVGASRRTTRMALDARKCTVTVECEQSPTFVRFNAGGALFGTLTVKQDPAAWRAELALDVDPLGRVEAARALARAWSSLPPGDEATRRLTLAVLARALVEDGAIAVRVAAAAALGKVKGDVARVALGCALYDLEPRVRTAAALALGEFKDEDLAAELVIARFDNERTHEVRAAALASIGRVGRSRAAPALVKLADDERIPPRLRGAALVAAAGIDELPPELLASTVELATRHGGPGAPLELRSLAIAALGKLAGRSEGAADALVRLLDDPLLPIVKGALDALGEADLAVRVVRVVPALVAFHGKTAFDDLRGKARELLQKLAESLPK